MSVLILLRHKGTKKSETADNGRIAADLSILILELSHDEEIFVT